MSVDAWSFLDHRFASPPSQLQTVRLYEDERPWLSVKVPLGLKSMKEFREGFLLTSAMGLLTKTGNAWTKKTTKRFKERSERDKIESSEFHKPLPSLDLSFALARDPDWFDWNSSMQYVFGHAGLSTEFHDDWIKTCALLRDQGADVSRGVVIPVHLRFVLGEAYQQEDRLRAIADLVRHIVDESNRLRSDLPRFKVQSIELDASELMVTTWTVSRLQELLAVKVRVRHLSLPSSVSKRSNEWRSLWASLLLTVFGHPSTTATSAYPIQEVSVSPSDEAMWPALGSVLVSSTNVHHIKCLGNKDANFKWVYFALLSAASASSASSVTLDFKGKTAAADLNVFGVVHPQTQLLAGAKRAKDEDLGSVHLETGTSIQLSDVSTDVFVVQKTEGETFQILRRDTTSSNLDILVPGYGSGKVERSTVLEKRRRLGPSASPVSDSTTSPYSRNLHIVESAYFSHLPKFLTSCGDFVKSLVLKGGRGRNTEYMAEILTKCPNVQSLTIVETSGPLLDGITNSYNPGRGPRELIFRKWKEDEETSVVKFCDQLADPTTPIAQRLKKLVLNEKSGDGWPFKVETAKAFARVLHSTTPLHHFEVYMPPKAVDFCLTFKDRLFDRSRAADKENGIDRFADITRPVPMRAQCAFLSVAPRTLGQENLKRIIEYAAFPTSNEVILDWCTGTKLIKVPKSVLMFKDLY